MTAEKNRIGSIFFSPCGFLHCFSNRFTRLAFAQVPIGTDRPDFVESAQQWVGCYSG
ncbi:MAG: hypothetical protein Ct9H300mP15_21380 [Gemmatimonadota bacterium]|nr:MAG: hypothetical protein Ct9H300mP15_21380 [Gemmatimonadota bacterium]